MENRVTWFPTTENWREKKFEIILVFLKWFLLDFIGPVTLCELLEFLWILFEAKIKKIRKNKNII